MLLELGNTIIPGTAVFVDAVVAVVRGEGGTVVCDPDDCAPAEVADLSVPVVMSGT